MLIHLYAPPKMLRKAPEEMDLAEFIEAVAMARFAQKQLAVEVAMGIALAFSEQ